jgi:hypothetical protein
LGNVLINKGNFHWEYLEPSNSGFLAEGDKNAMVKLLNADGSISFLVSENGGSLQSYSLQSQPEKSTFYRVEPDDWYVLYEIDDQVAKTELYHGSGFLSSSSRFFQLSGNETEVSVVKYNGERRPLRSEK